MIDRARQFLLTAAAPVVVACDNDVDGLTSAVIVRRALRARGVACEVLPAERGEHVHQARMQRRLRARAPGALVVVDQGSRPGPILPSVPTLVIDHHDASSGAPDVTVFVSGASHEPVPSTSVLTYIVCGGLPGVEDAAWLAALGAVADLGSAAPFADVLGIQARGTAWTKAVSLLNAARRAPAADTQAALDVLERAPDVRAIAAGTVPGCERLERYRREVQAEVTRCARTAPVTIGNAAVVRVTSRAQVHPLLAIRWATRLAPRIVVVANDGFIEGRVNFAVRCRSRVDLLAWLRSLPFSPSSEGEYANGHPQATGGSLTPADFDRFVAAVSSAPDPVRQPTAPVR